MKIKLVRAILVAAAVATLAGCASFSRKPPLPKHASIERAGSPAGTDYRALVEEAEIIYFPEERAASGAKAEPAALLLEAVQQSGKPFAIGWALIGAAQQPLLDQLQVAIGSARDELIAKLELGGTGRAREHCRSVLREARSLGVRHVALRPPNALLEKLGSGANLTPEERELVPRGFTAPPGGFQAYAERLSGSSQINERALAGAYRAEVLRRQFAAETIVRHFRDAGSDARLIVFADATHFADGQGVPYYVAQKTNLRQLVLGPELAEPARTPLLTGLERSLRPGFEVVNRTPRASGD